MVRPVLSLVLGFVGVIGLPIAALIVAGGSALIGAGVAVAAVAALAVAVWVVRGGGGDDGGEDGGGGGAGEGDGDGGGPGGPDWAAFDREREEWEHSSRR